MRTADLLDCHDPGKPEVLCPLKVEEKTITFGSQLQIRCIGLVGPRLTSCDGGQCDIGWKITVDRRTVPVSNSTHGVHVVTEWM